MNPQYYASHWRMVEQANKRINENEKVGYRNTNMKGSGLYKLVHRVLERHVKGVVHLPTPILYDGQVNGICMTYNGLVFELAQVKSFLSDSYTYHVRIKDEETKKLLAVAGMSHYIELPIQGEETCLKNGKKECDTDATTAKTMGFNISIAFSFPTPPRLVETLGIRKHLLETDRH